MGGDSNAATSTENTCFPAQLLAEGLSLAPDLVTDVVFPARCTDSGVELEREIVLEEIALRTEDTEQTLLLMGVRARPGMRNAGVPCRFSTRCGAVMRAPA